MTEKPEKVSWLALLPVLATLLFYLLPDSFQERKATQFVPQIVAYLGLSIWALRNTQVHQRLGLMAGQLLPGLGWGCLTGLILGTCNTSIILMGVPVIGEDVEFLKLTPHAQVSPFIMVPWGILTIAILVELNFRGFLLNRLIVLLDASHRQTGSHQGMYKLSQNQTIAIVASALVFAFDPFMVTTFQHLHWIAVWDGLIWGWLLVRLRNLYVVITAHALEVLIMYLSIRVALT